MIKTIQKDGYNLHIIKTKKFKTISLKLIFWNVLKEEELALINMLADNLLFSSFNCKTNREMFIEKQNLYNTSIFSSIHRSGTNISVEFELSCIEDKYTEPGNLKKSIEFLFDCLNKPNVCNNAFDSVSFNITKDHLKNAIISEKENPNYYAYKRYKTLIANKNILTGSILGTLEDLNKINENNLYDFYNKFFNNNHIDIYVVGNVDCNFIDNIIADNMKFKSNVTKYIKPYTFYEKDFSETIDNSKFSQSKLIMGSSIKKLSEFEKKYVSTIYNIIFGNSPNSKLFKSVREEKSYAYSISSSLNRLDGMFTIFAGISSINYEASKKEILHQIDEMKKGNFTDKDIRDAKQTVLSILKEINDNSSSMIDHYHNYLYYDADSINNACSIIKSIKKEDIVKLAKKINIDTVYLLKEDANEKSKN